MKETEYEEKEGILGGLPFFFFNLEFPFLNRGKREGMGDLTYKHLSKITLFYKFCYSLVRVKDSK